MFEKIKSRKFILACVSALLVILIEGLDLKVDRDVVMAFAGIIVTYLLGQSAVDAVKAKNGG